MTAPILLPSQAESEALKLVRAENATRLKATALMIVAWLNQTDGQLRDRPAMNQTEEAI